MCPPDASVEPEITDQQSPAKLVENSSFLKAKHIAAQIDEGLILAANTVAECQGKILGKPVNREHAKSMLQLMSGQLHRVLTGVTLWHRPSDRNETFVETTHLKMDDLADKAIEDYLDSQMWVGKAGGFGFQDQIEWIHIVEGSESNVVGLPMEALAKRIGQFLTDD